MVGVCALVIGVALGYMAASSSVYNGAYKAGYDKAVADSQATQAEIAKNAADEAAKAANPFQTTNPLEGVETNPFEETAKKLNPFAQ